ncbi:MAG: DUF1566 domain-containing protein [Desulfobacterales bacterium]|nr:DUF1566 domain-containing protein [Desulfobacterales bacterium]
MVTGNIKSGVSIFGVAGDSNVVNTSTGDAVAGDLLSGKKAWVAGSEVTGTASSVPAPVEKTGQSLCYDNFGFIIACTGTGQDGETHIQIGTAWPDPRFIDNDDGTVTDNLTDLIWLKKANCITFYTSDTNTYNYRSWANALTSANSLATGMCGLTDSSSAGDWRLPNRKELQSLIDLGNHEPTLPTGHAFTGVQYSYYWSSSSNEGARQDAWVVDLSFGEVLSLFKPISYYVWPVRAGQ